jgi:hypothetical protein
MASATIRGPFPFRHDDMSIDSEVFTRYAKAEKEFCEKAGAMFAQVIQEIEDKHGIAIAEVRATMDRAGPDHWDRANCVLVREAQSDALDTAMVAQTVS